MPGLSLANARVLFRSFSTSLRIMGKLVNGVWKTDAELAALQSKSGAFVPDESSFRDRVTADGSSGFKAEKGRYHIYVCYACPFAHRTLVLLKLKGLESVISYSPVDPVRPDEGWSFGQEGDMTKDPLFGHKFLYQVYTQAKSDVTTRVSVPVLWDKQKGTIVNNDSAEIMRMLNCEFKEFADPKSPELYPPKLQKEIDKMNDFVGPNINNGVYKAGFATKQAPYDEAVQSLFAALDHVDNLLANQRYLVGDHVTEADWRLFTTLVRFDPVYVGHFKCNIRRIVDYKNLSRYFKELCNVPGIKDTVNMDHIKRSYYITHTQINPTKIVPLGPEMEF